ncbi:MAG: D-sedoheptulose 7-phosphate isomerase [Rhodospirillaceae bacterium]|nr:D-sedoheptulose 7-phosphate isomerase [Rhodospirillaceae bacterium]
MDMEKFFSDEFDEHAEVLAATRAALGQPFAKLVAAATLAIKRGGKIVFFGNGGSAADAQHLATELVVRFKKDRPPIAAIALTTDTSALTAIGNDFSFEDLFARQVEALVREGDLAIGISTSGNSENVIRALTAANKLGAAAAGLTGKDGGRMAGLVDPLVAVPSTNTARIQEMHIMIGHMLCAGLENELGLA